MRNVPIDIYDQDQPKWQRDKALFELDDLNIFDTELASLPPFETGTYTSPAPAIKHIM